MLNPFSLVLNRLQFDGPNTQNRAAYFRAMLLIGQALHAANPTAWQSGNDVVAEVKYRVAALIGVSPVNVEFAQFLQENVR